MDNDDDLPDARPSETYDTLANLPEGLSPADRPKVPTTLPPPGACDSHVHVLGGAADFALSENRPENPAGGRSWKDWLQMLDMHISTLELERVVVVQSMLHGTDNAITLDTLRHLGSRARGVAMISEDADDALLTRLADAGIKAARMNLVHGGAIDWNGAKTLAPRLAAHGMHLQVLIEADHHMEQIAEDIRTLPVPIVFDHIGWPDVASGPRQAPVETLRRLLGEGRAYAKISGVYRFCDAPWDDADEIVASLVAANPEQCLWGSDWPHILLDGAEMPDAGLLVDAFHRAVTDAESRQKVWVDTPAALYGF